jgi:hypothetical protein
MKSGTRAFAFDAGVEGIERQEPLEIALPACIQPIDDDSNLVEIFRQMRRTIRYTSPGGLARFEVV